MCLLACYEYWGNKNMHKKSLLHPLFLASLSSVMLSIPTTHATQSEIVFSGFATFAYAKTISDADEGTLQGISDEGEYRDFNKLGLRLDADLQDNLSFTAQLTAHGGDDYQPEVDWLFATYHFLPNLALSVGKVRVPLYMYSDYLDVGYAYQWISPPYSVYGVPSFSSMEGAKISWTTELGADWSSELLLWGGRTDEALEELGGENLLIDDGLGLAWSVERDWLSLRAVYFQGVTSADVSAQIAPLDAGLQALEQGIQMISGNADFNLDVVRDDLAYTEADSRFMGLGAFLDFEYTFFGSEITVIDVDKSIAVGELSSAYVMAGVRLPANWALSLTYSVDRDDVNEDVYEQLETLTAPYLDFDPSGGLRNGVEGIIRAIEGTQINDTDTWTLGSRWDFHRSASFKMEYLIQKKSYRDLVTAEEFSQKPRAFRLALDMVF
ncbi:MAG: hypothetical protein HRU20_07325 [Pseudomonadales bacterium]|nr:hypothetical protein [Pseudomonadales bacterium]